jgi:hypothetical protein
VDRDRCTLRHITDTWMRYECWWSLGLRWRHLVLMDRDRCTLRRGRGMWGAATALVELGADIGALNEARDTSPA